MKIHFNVTVNLTKKFKNKKRRDDPSEPKCACWYATHAWGRDNFSRNWKKNIEFKVSKDRDKKIVKKCQYNSEKSERKKRKRKYRLSQTIARTTTHSTSYEWGLRELLNAVVIAEFPPLNVIARVTLSMRNGLKRWGKICNCPVLTL